MGVASAFGLVWHLDHGRGR